MEETKKKKELRDSKGDLNKYIVIAIVTFVTFCCCSLFFFLLYRYHSFTAFFHKLTGVLQPIIIGFIVAYLINPIMMFLENHLLKLIEPRMKNKRKAKKAARSVSVAGALIFFLLIIFLLLDMVVPQLMQSIQNMIVNLPSEVNGLIKWIEQTLSADSETADKLSEGLLGITNWLEEFLQKQLLPQAKIYIASITSGVINMVMVLFNFIIGLIISIYLLMSKETFVGQGKKLIYTIFSPKMGNRVLHTMRMTNQMFGGFISGKILDSAIIGILCYIGLLILRMPYSLLVAVIVGVTNIIPFFGPYIGAVPSFILIVLADPWKGLYFLVFILVLQQIDGNIIGPKILGNSTGLSSFWVIFAILVGGGMFGFIGMLLGVPTFAVIYYLARELTAYILRRRKLPEDTSSYIKMSDVNLEKRELRYEEKEK